MTKHERADVFAAAAGATRRQTEKLYHVMESTTKGATDQPAFCLALVDILESTVRAVSPATALATRHSTGAAAEQAVAAATAHDPFATANLTASDVHQATDQSTMVAIDHVLPFDMESETLDLVALNVRHAVRTATSHQTFRAIAHATRFSTNAAIAAAVAAATAHHTARGTRAATTAATAADQLSMKTLTAGAKPATTSGVDGATSGERR